MNTTEELDIITRMRGEVMSRQDVTGENLFLAWGYPTVIVLLAEFAAHAVVNPVSPAPTTVTSAVICSISFSIFAAKVRLFPKSCNPHL